MTIGVCYDITDNNYIDSDEQLKMIVILGDFNRRDINWTNLTSDNEGEKPLTNNQDLYLVQQMETQDKIRY